MLISEVDELVEPFDEDTTKRVQNILACMKNCDLADHLFVRSSQIVLESLLDQAGVPWDRGQSPLVAVVSKTVPLSSGKGKRAY